MAVVSQKVIYDLCPFCWIVTPQMVYEGLRYYCLLCRREFTEYERTMLSHPPCCP